ncbi:MAG: cell division transport system permease protein [Bacteroidales bacterium]|nr:cell division transport system permease protein [Bacteroidales bacterium]
MKSTSQEDKITRRRLRSAYLTTMVSLALVLFVTGLLLLIGLHARKLAFHVKENLGFSLYFSKSAREAEILRFKKSIDTMPWIRATQYISPEDASDLLKQELGEDFTDFLGYNPLQASLQIKLKSEWTHPDSVKKLEAAWKKNPMVIYVDYQRDLISQLNKNVKTISLVLSVLILLMMVVSIGLMNNTIRLAVYSKRFLIRSMLLVGATRSFIRKPFVLQGLFQGFISAVLSMLLLGGLLYTTVRQIPELSRLADNQLLMTTTGALMLLGMLVPATAYWLAVNRYLNMKIDHLYF